MGATKGRVLLFLVPNDLPDEVLMEHLTWSVDQLTETPGVIKIESAGGTVRNHPFEGPEVFDDYIPNVSRGTHTEGGFVNPWPHIDAALRALRESRERGAQ